MNNKQKIINQHIKLISELKSNNNKIFILTDKNINKIFKKDLENIKKCRIIF